MSQKDQLIFCPLGGSGEIGMNMNLFSYGKPDNQKWLIVDIGVTFADDTLPGIDFLWKTRQSKMVNSRYRGYFCRRYFARNKSDLS